MSAEPPNQNQLGLVAGSYNLPFTGGKHKDVERPTEMKDVCKSSALVQSFQVCFFSVAATLTVRCHETVVYSANMCAFSVLGRVSRDHKFDLTNTGSWLPPKGSV